MKILFLVSGSRTPSTRFRVLAFVPHLRARGHRCKVAASFPQKYDHFPWMGFRPSQLLKRSVRWLHWLRAKFANYDVVFVERELFDDDTSNLEEAFRRIAPAMVLDVDDGVFLTHPEKFDRIARISDVIIAGNRFLEEHLRPLNDHIVLIPTCVELASYGVRDLSAASPTPVIGWMGTTGNLNYLKVAAEGLRRVAQRHRFVLRLIAPSDEPIAGLDLRGVEVEHRKWDGATEVDELRGFDIGLMPLFPDNEWDIYKCGLKLIQYMAVSVVGVASPVGVNADIVEHGRNGLLATTPDEWEQALEQLLSDPALRRRLGLAARETVEQHYSVEGNVAALEAALQTALDANRSG